jgi:hypothetical protein
MMGKRGKQPWSKKCLPLHSIRVRRERKSSGRGWIEVRMIKFRMGGKSGLNWMPLARFTWEQMHGPVPKGMRVVHLDGNTLNDNPANYGLLTAGEVIRLYHCLDREMSEANRWDPRRRAATAASNRLRGQVKRAIGLLPTRWYAADLPRRVVYDQPFRSRRQLAATFGLSVSLNGRLPRRKLPVTFHRGRELTDRFGPRGFTRQPLGAAA